MSTVTAVITCMTDGERPFLREAVESALVQDELTVPLVCVAEDNPWLEDALDGLMPFIAVLRLPLQPAGLVRNAAVAAATTPYVGFLDGDDAWEPTKVGTQVRLLQQHGLDVIASRHVLVREDGRPFFYGFARGVPMTSSWLAPTRVFLDHPFGDRQVAQDVELWNRIAPNLRCGVAEQFLLRYRIRAGSASTSTPSMTRKRAFERRSHLPGGRQALLATSRAAAVAVSLRDAVKPSGHLLRVR